MEVKAHYETLKFCSRDDIERHIGERNLGR